jgi:predicted O-methyltransferase YrrM
MCDALAALGLLHKHGQVYCNSALAREFLLTGAPGSQVDLLLHGANLYERWAKLADVVKTGQPAKRDIGNKDDRRCEARAFALAMASSGRLGARETAAKLDLSGVRRLLDIGGGPGLYAIEFARRAPRLQAVVFDNSDTLAVARAFIKRAGLASRVTVRAGDALVDDLGGPYDFVFISNVVHSLSPEQNQRLIDRAATALTPGGRVCVKDFFLSPRRTRPLRAALFAVNMLVGTEGGDCYTLAEIKSWLCQAGLACERQVRLTSPSRLVIGRKAKGVTRDA